MSKCDNCIHVGVCHYIMFGDSDEITECRHFNEERPKGKWEIVDEEGGKIWNCVCTKCGHDPQEYIGGTEDWWLRKPLPNYCSRCGADMRGIVVTLKRRRR